MHFTPAALALLTLVVPIFAAPASLITIEKANGPTNGKHIITLKPGVEKADFLELSQLKACNVTHNWDIINGFAGRCDGPTLHYLRSHSDVESIAEDGTMSINKDLRFYSDAESITEDGTMSINKDLRSRSDVESIAEDGTMSINKVVTQLNTTWGLERISHPKPLPSMSDPKSLTYNYTYSDLGGKGVDIYIIDTGINIAHVSFQGRAIWGATIDHYLVNRNDDDHGHGTHCAGIAASYDYGVAKSATLIAVKVLARDGSGSNSDIISGMEWTIKNAASRGRPSVASMSMSGAASRAVDDAVRAMTDRGVHVVVAAGDVNIDAETRSPGRARSALTVAAMNITDTRASFSNYGIPIKVFAPGVSVVSTWTGSNTATRILSGTSTATPYISGLVAYFLSLTGDMPPNRMVDLVQRLAIKGAVKDPGPGSVNLLANNKSIRS